MVNGNTFLANLLNVVVGKYLYLSFTPSIYEYFFTNSPSFFFFLSFISLLSKFFSRKAKYCSKSCQSKAWADGHRWWCVERPHNAHPPNPTATSSTTVAAAAAVVAAAPPPPPPTEQVVHLEDNVVTSDVLAIPIGNGHQVDDTTETTHNRRSSLPVTATTQDPTNNITMTTAAVVGNRPPPPRDGDLLFYHQRRNSRSVRSLASGSSTEVEADTDNSHDRPRDLMDVD